MNAGFNARGYERSAYAMVLLLALVGSIVSLPAAVRASGLECPTTATGSLSIASDLQITRMTTGNDADLANEIDGLIGRARAEAPTASIAETANLLIAAYCPVVAKMTRIDAGKMATHATVRSRADAAAFGHCDATRFVDCCECSAGSSDL